ncbi:hypothetical protein Godav_015067, partial [Gossypium davidsonii]|nr:hypothetical protein [Gossypium davidsonii]
SSSFNNSDNSINLEDINVTSYKSDEENTSTDEEENIEIPEPMDTNQTDQDPYGKRKLEPDLQQDDYLRSFHKNYKQVEITSRIFGNQTENIATNEIKSKNLGESSTQPVPHRIDDLNKRNVAKGGIYLDPTNLPITDYEKTIDEWAQSKT